MRWIAACLALLAATAAGAETRAKRPAECAFTVDGQDAIRGRCSLYKTDDAGSFDVTSADGLVRARVEVTAKGVADAYWNGKTGASQADVALGVLVLVGACWASGKAKLCITQ